MRTSVDIDDAAFVRGLADAFRDIRLTSRAQLTALGIDIANRAKGYAPVDTGRLRSSITHEPGQDRRGPYVDIGTSVSYAAHVEFGTSKMSARPFLRPALAEAAGMWRLR